MPVDIQYHTDSAVRPGFLLPVSDHPAFHPNDRGDPSPLPALSSGNGLCPAPGGVPGSLPRSHLEEEALLAPVNI